MIRQIEIDNFKSIRHADIELGNINLFIGENGAGKSNILEAIGVISAAVYGTVDDESLLRRGVRPGVPRLYKTSNRKYKTGPHIHFSVRSETCFYSVSLLNPLKNPKPRWSFKTERLASGDLEQPYTRGVKKNPNPEMGGVPMILSTLPWDSDTSSFFAGLRNYALYNPNTVALRGLAQDIQMRPPVGLAGGGLSEGLRKLLQSAVNNEQIEEALESIVNLFSWVEDFSTSAQISHILSGSVPREKNVITFTDRYMKRDNNRLTAADASEGVLYVLFLLVLCMSPGGPKIFAVDNIEQTLNPRIVKRLATVLQEWFKDYIPEKQMFCTAHNPVILDGFDLLDDTVRLFVVDRDSDGLTRIRRITVTEELVRASKEKDISWSQLWVDGYIGGVPNV